MILLTIRSAFSAFAAIVPAGLKDMLFNQTGKEIYLISDGGRNEKDLQCPIPFRRRKLL